jgi:hypothetical protein
MTVWSILIPCCSGHGNRIDTDTVVRIRISSQVIDLHTYLLRTCERADREIRVIEREWSSCLARRVAFGDMRGKDRIVYRSVVLDLPFTYRLYN